MSSDEKQHPRGTDTSVGDLDRRAFLKALGIAFASTTLPEALTACSETDQTYTVDGVAELTARQTISVVRPEDLLVLTIGLVNLKKSTTGTLVKISTGYPAYLIVDFPPQAIVEDAVAYATASDPPDPNNPPIKPGLRKNAWLGGNSRIVFLLPTDYTPVPFSLSAILGVCATSGVVVAGPMAASSATTVPLPTPSTAPTVLEDKLAALGADRDPTLAARKMQREGTLDGLSAWMQQYQGSASTPTEFSDGSTSRIELPYRLQLSPNSLAGFTHAAAPVQGASGATEMWHTILGARLVGRNVGGPADERNAYLRTVRALSTRDSDAALLNNSTVAWDAPDGRQQQNPALAPGQRKLIVTNSSQASSAQAIQVNRLMLSTLGGYLDAHAEFSDLNIAAWIHKITNGRENFVQTTQIGALYPFGHTVTKLQITSRNDDPKRGAIGVLYKYDVFLFRAPTRSYRPTDYGPTAQAPLLKWPFSSIEVKQTSFTAQTSPFGITNYWPVDLSGTPIMVPVVGYDARGHAIQFSVPLYFVAPPVASTATTANSTGYGAALNHPPVAAPRTAPFPAMGVVAPGDSATSLNVSMGGQRISYAYSDRDDTTYATRNLYVSAAAASGESFPYVPVVSGAVLDVEAVQAYTNGAPVTATYHPSFAAAGLDPTQNKSQLLFKLTAPVKADFRNRSDGGTGFVAPNIAFDALSKTTGPSHDVTASAPTSTASTDGGFDPKSYLNLAADELDKIRIFGVFRLIDIVKMVDPDEAASDMRGLTDDIADAALRYAPKFVTEALNEVEKILSTIDEVKSTIEGIWAHAKELLGAQYVEAVVKAARAGTPDAVFNAPLAGVIGNAVGIDDAVFADVIKKATVAVVAARFLYDALCDSLDRLLHADIDALAGSADTKGSLPAVLAKGIAFGTAMADLAAVGARATVAAAEAAVDAVASAPVDSAYTVANALLQIAPGLKDAFLKKFGLLQEIIGDVNDVVAFANRLKGIFDQAKQAIHSLSDLTLKLDWHPKIGSFFFPGTNWLVFRPATEHALALAMEVRTKAKDGKPAGVDVSCRLDHFDLCLGPLDSESKPAIAMQFDHISFDALAGKKPDVDVKINGMSFGGPLSFLQTLRQLIPLDGFSDPPYLKVDAGGIHAGFSCHIPNVAIGVFSMENLSLSATLEIPFFSDSASSKTLLFTFSFCDKDHPFLITVSALGGGGYFVFSLSPSGIESLEASLCVGAQVAFSLLDIAQGNVQITLGITFSIKEVATAGSNTGKDVSLSAYLRIHGELDVLGIVSVSIDVRLTMVYDITAKTMVAEGDIEIDVSVLFFSFHRSVHLRKEFHACNNDPTLRQLMPPNALNQSQYWVDYCNAYA